MYCVSLVTKDHVKEAYRLLNKSIIRVEEPDIDLEDAEQANISVEQDETNGVPSSEDTDKQTASDATSDSAVQKKKRFLSLTRAIKPFPIYSSCTCDDKRLWMKPKVHVKVLLLIGI